MHEDFKSRKLSKLSGSSRPVRLLFLDTETKVRTAKLGGDKEVIFSGFQELFYGNNIKDIQLHRFNLGWTCYNRYISGKGFVSNDWKFWSDTKQLCNYIESLVLAKTTLYFFGHNIFFDLQVSDFFYYFTKSGWVLNFLYDKGLTYILIISKGTRCIKCLSTTNYFPVSVSTLGEFLGIPKLDISFDSCSRKQLITYCKRDTLIIRTAIEYFIKFIDNNDLGNFCLGRPSQALTAYRYRFMNKPIHIHKNKQVQELEKNGYFGGRVECGFLGKLPKDKYISLDVNSMYPFVMLNNKIPIKLIDYLDNVGIRELPLILDKFAGVGEVLIATDEPAYPIRHHNKLVFPVGSFITTLCSQGLRYAYEHKHLRSISRLSVYQQDYLFNDYINYFIKLKEKYSKEGNTFLREVSKYFLLYLYGKFAQQKDITVEELDITFDGYFREETFDLVTGRTEILTKLFNKRFTTFGREPAGCCFMAIAAHVTEYARFYLYDLMKRVGIDKVLYCDTDSLKIRKKDMQPLKSLIHPYKLGKLKMEEEFSKFIINGAKNYETDTTKKIKGVPSTAEQIDEYTYSYMGFMKQATHLRAEVTRYFIVKPQRKVVKPFYDKGKVLKDGSIIPLTLNEF